MAFNPTSLPSPPFARKYSITLYRGTTCFSKLTPRYSGTSTKQPTFNPTVFTIKSIFFSMSSISYKITLGSFHNILKASLRINRCLHKQSTLSFTSNPALNAPLLKIFNLIGSRHFKDLIKSKHLESSPTSIPRIRGSLIISFLTNSSLKPKSLNSLSNGISLFSIPNPKTSGNELKTRSTPSLGIPIAIKNWILLCISHSFKAITPGKPSKTLLVVLSLNPKPFKTFKVSLNLSGSIWNFLECSKTVLMSNGGTPKSANFDKPNSHLFKKSKSNTPGQSMIKETTDLCGILKDDVSIPRDFSVSCKLEFKRKWFRERKVCSWEGGKPYLWRRVEREICFL